MKIFGFSDFTYHKSSGRPEAPIQWQADAIISWLNFFVGIAFLFGAVFAVLRDGDHDSALYLGIGGFIVLGLSYARVRMLRRKRQEFSEAIATYNRMISDMTLDQ
jgi:O-antigen/teichoic acid export membrane protein